MLFRLVLLAGVLVVMGVAGWGVEAGLKSDGVEMMVGVEWWMASSACTIPSESIFSVCTNQYV
jgi:hypothetical protein